MPADLATRTLFMLPERLTEAQFYASLATFTFNNWYPHPTITSPWTPAPVPAAYDPVEAGIGMDLQYLYVVVLSLGGYQAVENAQRWSLVALSMSLWPEDQDQPREIYRKYLWYYEVYSRQVRRLFVARKRKNRDPREYSAQAFVKGQEDNDREDYHVSCLPWSAIESRLESQKQGVLDGALVLSDYFSLSPAVQLSIKQQTHLMALEVFTNPGEGVSAIFTSPASIRPSSSTSLDEGRDHDGSLNDEFLSEEAKKCKDAILTRNRNHIILTQIRMQPQRLPHLTSTELARFMYDEVNLSARRLKYPTKIDPTRVEIMAKLGSDPGIAEGPNGYTPTSSNHGDEDECTLSEYFNRDGMIGTVETPAWKAELIGKYGFKPRFLGQAEPPRVEKRGLNFHEYILAHGLDAPEVKRFFDDRLKLEGGFWEHEFERMRALERRVRGDGEILDKGWDKVSSVGSINTNSSLEPDSPLSSSFPNHHPPPGFLQRPMSLREYARRIAKGGEEPMEWGYLTPVESLKSVSMSIPPSEYPEPNPHMSVFPTTSKGHRQPQKTELLEKPGTKYTQQHQEPAGDTMNGDTSGFDQKPLGTPAFTASADGSQIGGQDYPGFYAQSDLSSLPSGEEIHIFANPNPASEDSTRKILSLPSGINFDITNVNPLNPPSYNYAQRWLQERASDNTVIWQDTRQYDTQYRITTRPGPTEEVLSDIQNLINRATTPDPPKTITSHPQVVHDYGVIDDDRKLKLSLSEKQLLADVFDYEMKERQDDNDEEEDGEEWDDDDESDGNCEAIKEEIWEGF